jgi:hypothetical protein
MRRYLLCTKARGGCGSLSILLDETEDYVAQRLFDELDKPEFLDAVTAADDHSSRREELLSELKAVERKREQQAAMWADDHLTDIAFQAAQRRLDEREHKARVALAEIPPSAARLPDITLVRELWDGEDGLTLDEKRQFLRLFIARVTIHPAVRRGTGRFDGNHRIKIKWTAV